MNQKLSLTLKSSVNSLFYNAARSKSCSKRCRAMLLLIAVIVGAIFIKLSGQKFKRVRSSLRPGRKSSCARNESNRMNKTLEVISTEKAPKALGPYSQAIKANGFVFVSGQIPIQPSTGELFKGTITEQTSLVLTNLGEILKCAGTSLDKVVKTTVFLHDMNDFDEMNKKYAEFFSSTKPARATVQVSRLPKDVSIEIECVAVE